MLLTSAPLASWKYWSEEMALAAPNFFWASPPEATAAPAAADDDDDDDNDDDVDGRDGAPNDRDADAGAGASSSSSQSEAARDFSARDEPSKSSSPELLFLEKRQKKTIIFHQNVPKCHSPQWLEWFTLTKIQSSSILIFFLTHFLKLLSTNGRVSFRNGTTFELLFKVDRIVSKSHSSLYSEKMADPQRSICVHGNDFELVA